MEKENIECQYCHEEIQIGNSLIEAQEGVLGFKGIIPLGDLTLFCSTDCLSKFFGDDVVVKKRRRIA